MKMAMFTSKIENHVRPDILNQNVLGAILINMAILKDGKYVHMVTTCIAENKCVTILKLFRAACTLLLSYMKNEWGDLTENDYFQMLEEENTFTWYQPFFAEIDGVLENFRAAYALLSKNH